MNFSIGEGKQTLTTLLPLEQRIHITLETQEEIDQLYAMLNYVPIIDALDIRNNDWYALREILSKTDKYLHWHNNLCKQEG